MKRCDQPPVFEVLIPAKDGHVRLVLSGITEEQATLIEKALQPGNKVFTPVELEVAISGWAIESVINRNRRSTDAKP